jgi:hypothetical protein
MRRTNWSLGVVLLGVAAAAAPGAAMAQVDPAAPFTTAATNGPILPLPAATGLLPDAWITQKGPNAAHGARFTWGPDLITLGSASKSTWLGWVYPSPPASSLFAVSPAFRTRLEADALPAATSHLGKLSAGGIASPFVAYGDLSKYDPQASAVPHVPTAPQEQFYGFAPVRARWLRSQWGHANAVWAPEKKFLYADYAGFDEVRLQGARLYCAARRAQFVQNGQRLSLGERVGFSVKLLGQKIDFLVVEPAVALDGPQKFFVPGDGAQAFIVPLLFGTKVTPIRGIGLPGFDEVRVPVDLVSADSEVRTFSDLRPVWTEWNVGGGGGVSPGFQLLHSKEHHSVGHADAVLTAGFWLDQETGADNRFGLDADVTLFYAGPVRISGLIGLHYEVGHPHVGTSRVLAQPPAGWPSLTRAGRLFENPATGIQHHDGPWALGARRGSPWLEWQVQPEGKTDPFWTWPILPALRPHDFKALTDDDHLLESATSLSLTLGLKGSIGISSSFITLTPEVTGTLTGTVTQSHVLRDALMGQEAASHLLQRMNPVTSVTVRPRQRADVSFDGLTAGLTFGMDLGWPIGDIEFFEQFFKMPGATLANYDSDDDLTPADERWQLRIGTGSSFGKPMTKPPVWSHLPKGAEYATFDQDVAACLADPAVPPPPPPACAGSADGGKPPRRDLCLYGPTGVFQENFAGAMVPSNVCTNLQPWLSTLVLSSDQKACLSTYFGLLCAPVSKTQSPNGVWVVSRVWNLNEAMNQALLGAAKQCATAFLGSDADPADPAVPEAAKKVLDGMVSVGICDTDATLIPDDKVLEPVDPTKAPKATDGPACSPAK